MAESEGTLKKSVTVKKTATPKAEKVKVEAATEPKATAKPRKAAVAKKALASVTPIDINREPSTVTVSPSRVSTEEIARLAHRYWLERGCKHGHDAEDWFRAEQELSSKAS